MSASTGCAGVERRAAATRIVSASAAILALSGTLVVLALPASGSFPGTNGKIAFVSDRHHPDPP